MRYSTIISQSDTNNKDLANKLKQEICRILGFMAVFQFMNLENNHEFIYGLQKRINEPLSSI